MFNRILKMLEVGIVEDGINEDMFAELTELYKNAIVEFTYQECKNHRDLKNPCKNCKFYSNTKGCLSIYLNRIISDVTEDMIE